VARQVAMLSYRTPQSLSEKFNRSHKKVARSPSDVLAHGGGHARAAAAMTSHHDQPQLQQAPYFEVEGYLNYQGEKFIRRFDPLCYVRLTQLLDSHDLGSSWSETLPSSTTASPAAPSDDRFREKLRVMKLPSFVVGIDSDILYPVRPLYQATRV
jgi:homoserine acetyltransferase